MTKHDVSATESITGQIPIPGSDLVLPPYGYVNSSYQWDVDTRRVPEGFCIDGRVATPREWKLWVSMVVDALSEHLWPMFDSVRREWRGTALIRAMDLTDADFELMDGLHAMLLHTVEVDGRSLARTQVSMFVDEDIAVPGVPPLPTLDIYLQHVPAETMTKLKDAIRKGLVGLGPAQLRFKELMQRPRPYQVALLLQRPFRHELAKSSQTPAMISGHCYQSLVTRTAGYMAHRRDLEAASSAVESLQQYVADVGDRRVFAGVHYPSDNISSWYCALRMCSHMFSEAGQVAKNFMCAVIARSAVFTAITEHANSAKDSPYLPGLRLLAQEMKTPAARTDA